MIETKKIYNAFFTDPTEEHIEVQSFIDEEVKPDSTLKEGQQLSSIVIPFDPTEDNCKAVLGVISIDKLREITYTKRKLENEALISFAQDVAREEGKVNLDPKYYSDLEKKEYYQRLIDFLLEENEESIEDLFAFKIALFDTEKVKNATKATKSKIRKAKTALEAFKVIA